VAYERHGGVEAAYMRFSDRGVVVAAAVDMPDEGEDPTGWPWRLALFDDGDTDTGEPLQEKQVETGIVSELVFYARDDSEETSLGIRFEEGSTLWLWSAGGDSVDCANGRPSGLDQEHVTRRVTR
jgi:hypothetical protein